MLDTGTKRRIDTARDILVGKVPDPKSQVEQITIALIYKFMDDMDAEAEELGGHRKFFTGDYARYGWAKLLRSGLGGHDILNLYSEGIAKMPENPGIPPLFRDIFKNAFLPYRDPETLRAFLKVIDEFVYDHSERLGDAFEYLLSVLGSQGDAGQFRTPRHIIDFIVEIIDPRKNEIVLDPACGTAGFLISSYKHILKANRGFPISDHASPNPQSSIQNPQSQIPTPNPQSTIPNLLTPDERGRLAANFKGYDISPDMVRLSLVNMYLHGFSDPHIYEYDALTSQERWNEHADVILANPPFMSPKGGIKPHNRFSVQSKRSEVLFVDYIAEHLTPTGRAGIIVPEGIIFQSQTAYKKLRKMLVEECLVAVISLPAGVFNPYSGVKTSILILDKTLAKKTESIAFFKVENDGFGLGAQRRPIDKNDLPAVLEAMRNYKLRITNGEEIKKSDLVIPNSQFVIVPKARIAAGGLPAPSGARQAGDYNLSGERYRENGMRVARFPHVRLVTIAEIAAGNSAPQGDEYFTGGEAPFVRTSDVGIVHLSAGFYGAADKVNQKAIDELRLRLFPSGTILFPKSGASTFLNHRVVLAAPAYVSSHLACIVCDETKALSQYVYQMLRNVDARQITPDQAYPSLRLAEIGDIKIPLPPLEVQKEIVAEIEGYQKVIDGARAVLENYRPHIPIDPDWPMVAVGDLATPEYGYTASAADEGVVRFIRITDISSDGTLSKNGAKYVLLTDEARTFLLAQGDILVARTGATYGKTMMFCEEYPAVFASYLIRLRFASDRVLPRYYWVFAQSDNYWTQAKALMTGGGQPQFNGSALKQVKAPLPPLDTQQAIVAEIEVERTLVNANRKLIARMEKKIQAALARVWGDSGMPRQDFQSGQ